jgi:HPt (histidine-containing phosphotransfer) domain-containing protein
MNELVAKFLPRFVTSARAQMAKVNSWLARRDQAEKKNALREMHSLKGDAGMLDLAEVAALAKECEKEVAKLHADSSDAEIEHVAAALRRLEDLIAGIEAAHVAKNGT